MTDLPPIGQRCRVVADDLDGVPAGTIGTVRRVSRRGETASVTVDWAGHGRRTHRLRAPGPPDYPGGIYLVRRLLRMWYARQPGIEWADEPQTTLWAE